MINCSIYIIWNFYLFIWNFLYHMVFICCTGIDRWIKKSISSSVNIKCVTECTSCNSSVCQGHSWNSTSTHAGKACITIARPISLQIIVESSIYTKCVVHHLVQSHLVLWFLVLASVILLSVFNANIYEDCGIFNIWIRYCGFRQE